MTTSPGASATSAGSVDGEGGLDMEAVPGAGPSLDKLLKAQKLFLAEMGGDAPKDQAAPLLGEARVLPPYYPLPPLIVSGSGTVDSGRG